MADKSTVNNLLKNQVPLILYEEPTGKTDTGIPFPYIEVPKEGIMPPVLFIFEYKHTGEFEPDDRGKESAIVDQIPHKYVDLEHLKDKLSPAVYDTVRTALGMKPLKEAQEAGQKILDKVYSNIGALDKDAEKERLEKLRSVEEVKPKLNDLKKKLENMQISFGLANDNDDESGKGN